MKKQWIALLTGCVLVCGMLVGCGVKTTIAVFCAMCLALLLIVLYAVVTLIGA